MVWARGPEGSSRLGPGPVQHSSPTGQGRSPVAVGFSPPSPTDLVVMGSRRVTVELATHLQRGWSRSASTGLDAFTAQQLRKGCGLAQAARASSPTETSGPFWGWSPRSRCWQGWPAASLLG